MVGEPGDALDVEVVGRLVEEQQLGVGDEQPGEREPAALATGHRADRGCRGRRRRGADAAEQPGQDVADAGVAGPDVLGQVAEHGLADRPPGVERVLLGEHADADAVGATLLGDAAGVGLLQAGHDAQQRGLAAAVDARRRRCGRPCGRRGETSSRTWEVPKTRETRSREMRLAIAD